MRHDIIEYVEISSVIGRTVTVTVDRPLGSYHPEHKNMYYPINYGYVEGIMAPDGEEQDAYILGVDEAIEKFTGKIIAIVHRNDDVEEKWVVGNNKMKLLYGTGNLAKLSAMRNRLEQLDIELIGLNDMRAEGKIVPKVIEDGNTPLENARLKAMAYYEAFQIPVFSCDSGLYFDNVPDEVQPGVHVRNVNGKCLSDDEMIDYYSGLVKAYGNLVARYRNAICFVMDDTHIYEAMEPSMESEKFILTDKPHSTIRKEGFPLDSISLDIKTNKYYYDLPEDKLEQVAVEDGFLEFFKNILNPN